MFESYDRFEGAPSKTKRALGNTDIEAPVFIKLETALKNLKVKYQSLYWLGNAWAHFSIPSRKIAISIYHCGDNPQIQRALWKNEGWDNLSVRAYQLRRSAQHEIEFSLKQALDLLCKASK